LVPALRGAGMNRYRNFTIVDRVKQIEETKSTFSESEKLLEWKIIAA
jgi:hypothetical protein